jgi:CheY-like chemotaxis protein
MKKNNRILLVDDDAYASRLFVEALRERGFEVLFATNVTDAKKTIASQQLDLAILDIMLPLGTDRDDEDMISARGGFLSGQMLAAWISTEHPNVNFVGLSLRSEPELVRWFQEKGAGFFSKVDYRPRHFADRIARILNHDALRGTKSFIVHGQDETTKFELKNYLQNTLHFAEPIILHEQPSWGRTIIEKFEEESDGVELVFVLLTPDDLVVSPQSGNEEQKRRARQNVIFELGYFLAKMGRRSGRVLLLHKGPIDLPSDIAGLVYVDITSGIAAAGELIRKELMQSFALRTSE